MADESQDYSEAARHSAAARGEALPDGSYPMRTCAEVRDAIESWGRAPASHRGELAALIRRRNQALGCHHHLDKLETE